MHVSVLVPSMNGPEPECREGLEALKRRGFDVVEQRGCSAIDAARNGMATTALLKGADVLFWIDSDIQFDPDDVAKLCKSSHPLIGGIYMKKDQSFQSGVALNYDAKALKKIEFTRESKPFEVVALPCGFTKVSRCVYESVRSHHKMPMCNEASGDGVLGFYRPTIIEKEDGTHLYQAEDYAFCWRAKEAGFKPMADPSIRLTHWGRFGYRVDDIAKGRSPVTPLHLGVAQ